VRDVQVLGDQGVLGADIVVDGDFGERVWVGCVRGRGGLAIAEEGGYDDEILGAVRDSQSWVRVIFALFAPSSDSMSFPRLLARYYLILLFIC